MPTSVTLYGIGPVHQAVLHGRRELGTLRVKQGKPSPKLKPVLADARERGVRVETVGMEEIARRAGTRNHQGVVLDCGELPTLDLEAWLEAQGSDPALLVALDQIEDPQNLGGIIRSAAFLGASGALTLSSKASPLSPVVSKASAGALEYFPMVEVGNLAESLRRLQDAGFWVAGAELGEGTVSYLDFEPSPRQVLVMGNEGAGLRNLTRKRCDALVRIDGVPGTESLNVGVAAGVLLARFASAAPDKGRA